MHLNSPLPRRIAAMAAAVVLASQALAAAETPLKALPYTPSLDPSAMDKSVSPCEDFYQYSCGGWIKNNPIPADQSRWAVYAKLANENQRYLWGVLESLADQKDASAGQRQLGDYFAACMNTTAVEKAGSEPLLRSSKPITEMRSKADLPQVLATLHKHGADFPFGFSSGQDWSDPERVIAYVSAGGLGLPDRDDYLRGDAKSKAVRETYRSYIAEVLQRMGQPAAQAKQGADRVLAIETDLARSQLTRVQQRNPYALKHPMGLKGLQALTPGFDWQRYREALGAPASDVLNVDQPQYMQALARMLKSASLADLQTYLSWHVARSSAPYLSEAWRQGHFAFYEHTLRGTPEPKPRWKQCVQWADRQLGEALGQEFVARNFSPETKAKVQRMTLQVEDAMAERIDAIDWMSKPTKAAAKEKLKAIVNKIGYPERWRDYSRYSVERGDFFGNVLRGNAFEAKRRLDQIGQPLDRGEWGMTPQTVNAYYNPQMNDINFPAAVLLPPLFDPKMDDAPNYGNTGATIGHELVHGFDDEGRQYDAKGSLRDWWSKADAKAFAKRADCIKAQYGQYTVVDDIKINSELTLGEDLADLGGVVLAWAAWQEQTKNQRLAPVDGLTPAQRFFIGYAQWDCSAVRPEAARLHARTDPHSPGRYRINGVVVNMPEFEDAFSCKPGQAMVKPAAKRCEVW